MRFDISKVESDEVTLYETLSDKAEITKRLDPSMADNAGAEREFVMTMKRGNGMMTFVINDKIFDANRVDEFIQSNSTEIWTIKNDSPMAHPFHAHAIQYQILDRDGIPASGVDLGWKDTFLVEAGESIRVIGKFEPINQGDYMYHCHILEHEDAGMMGYFRVGNSGNVKRQ
jgi:FtsP/CotA-like multicopper oxidase with cupredoxin domain